MILRVVAALAALAAFAPSTQALPGPSGSPARGERPPTIPALREWTGLPGRFVLARSGRVIARDAGVASEARVLSADLRRRTGLRLAVLVDAAVPARAGDVVLELGDPDRGLGREGYRLSVGAWVRIRARAAAGAFYGTRTVLQLLARGRSIAAGEARDRPRYPERGLMLDNGRRYFSPGWIRRRIREMAYVKLNQLHLHFSDNQGFRVESERHPEVVTRPFLTKAQVRGIVALARRHHIRVIGEIDMPGHLTAALRRHPELQLAAPDGVRAPDKLDVTDPAARRFARDLILEYLPLFGGRYWHAGADEYLSETGYDAYPQLRAWARGRYGPRANGADAYLGFIDWIDRLVRRRGRTLRVWNDGLSGGSAVRLRRHVVVDWWGDHSGPSPRALVARGHRVLNAGWWPTYYVVGPLGSVRPSVKATYEDWHVNAFGGLALNLALPPNRPVVLPARSRRVLGSELHVWNDVPDAETDRATARGIAPRLRVLAQRTWGSPDLAATYAGFVRVERAVGLGRDVD